MFSRFCPNGPAQIERPLGLSNAMKVSSSCKIGRKRHGQAPLRPRPPGPQPEIAPPKRRPKGHTYVASTQRFGDAAPFGFATAAPDTASLRMPALTLTPALSVLAAFSRSRRPGPCTPSSAPPVTSSGHPGPCPTRCITRPPKTLFFQAGAAGPHQLANLLCENVPGSVPTIVLGGFVPDATEQVFLLRGFLLKQGSVYYLELRAQRFFPGSHLRPARRPRRRARRAPRPTPGGFRRHGFGAGLIFGVAPPHPRHRPQSRPWRHHPRQPRRLCRRHRRCRRARAVHAHRPRPQALPRCRARPCRSGSDREVPRHLRRDV